MKNRYLLIITILTATAFSSCESSNNSSSSNFNTSVKGVIEGGSGQSLIFELLRSNGIDALDTVKLDETGNFEFGANVKGQGFYRIKLAQNNFVVLILSESENIEFSSNATTLEQNYTVTGSPETQRLQQFNQFVNKLYRSNDSLARASKMHQANRDVNAYMAANQFQQTLMVKKDNFIRGFVDENPGSLASLAAVENLNPDVDFLYYKKVADALKNEIPESPYFQSLNERVVEWSKMAVGSVAPDITMATPNGETLSLSSLRGNVVLVDFWASWCRPCRAENPNVVRTYNKYHANGFEVFSVSLVKSQQGWIQAIQQDGLIWPNHVSDLKHWQSAAAKLYNVKGIPQTYLLDRDGVILAKNLRGPALEQKLSELFGT
ncbi:MAG: AhpC/TSA family protein [Flavobacteriales bacterium]|nr:AhpC/TSA family protein [Flavobacteriales bacterium]